MSALRAHATQMAVDGMFFALSDNIGSRAFAVEHYRLVKGEPGRSVRRRGPRDGPVRRGLKGSLSANRGRRCGAATQRDRGSARPGDEWLPDW